MGFWKFYKYWRLFYKKNLGRRYNSSHGELQTKLDKVVKLDDSISDVVKLYSTVILFGQYVCMLSIFNALDSIWKM